MEEFIVIFLPVLGSPGEGDYYIDPSENRIRRVELFTEIGIREKNFKEFKKVVPFLCSFEYFYPGDKILYEEDSELNIVTGVLQDLYPDRGKAVVLKDGAKSLVETNKCYYPICEIFCDLERVRSKQVLTREDIDIRTVCPKCQRHSRSVSACGLSEELCHKNKIKEYAFIKRQK